MSPSGPTRTTSKSAFAPLSKHTPFGATAVVVERIPMMSKYENKANKTFRPSDRPLSEYEAEQKAQRKNMERLKAERLAREKAVESKDR
jgi:hypothetical protein